MSTELVESLQKRVKELEEELKRKAEQEAFVMLKNATRENVYVPHYVPGRDGVILAPGKVLTVNKDWYESLKTNNYMHLNNGKLVVVDPNNSDTPVDDNDVVNVTDEELMKVLKLSPSKFSSYVKKVDESGVLERLYHIARGLSENDSDKYPNIEKHLKVIKKRLKDINPNLIDIE